MRVSRAHSEAPSFSSTGLTMDIGEPPEHILRRLRSQDEHSRPRLKPRPQLGESEPDGGGARVAEMIGVDENASRLDPEIGTQQLRHASVRLMRDDVVYGVNRGPERARDRGTAIE